MAEFNIDQEIIQASPLATTIHSCKEVQSKTWMDYVKALLAIAGADGEVSQEELDWVFSDFLEVIGASDDEIEEIKKFDFKNVDLTELLSNLDINVPMNYKRTLVYDAVMMARADNVYSREEKEAVWKAAEILGVPYFIARTIEGLVNTEKSLEMIRKSLFELEEEGYPIVDLDKLNMKPASILERNTFGVKLTCEQTQKNYGFALMIIAGADGVISDAEKNWYLEQFVKVSNTPEEIAKEVMEYDFSSGNLEEVINNLKVDVTINFKRTLLYNAIKMASADAEFPEQEKDATDRVAKLLDITDDIAQTIYYLVDTEAKIAKMRTTLFEYN